jgi:hypothetical protein
MAKLINTERINLQYITAKMASESLGVTIARVHQMISEGKLQSWTIADRVCVARRDVVRMVKERE